MSRRCEQKLFRLHAIVAERAAWRDQLEQVKRMHGWLCEVEAILAKESARPPGEAMSNAIVGCHLDAWRERMARQLVTDPLSELEQECLRELLQVLSNLRPYVVQCYDREDFPMRNLKIAGLETFAKKMSLCHPQKHVQTYPERCLYGYLHC